ncbi:Abi family protein [Pseudomonas sp. MOB-449]|nr:Abi family protein [Pseudomonas sp. MOB-449]
MQEREQDTISAQYGVANGRTFASWLRSLNYLRNVCAHHSRLWSRNIVDQPTLPSGGPWIEPFIGDSHALARCYLLLCMTKHLLGGQSTLQLARAGEGASAELLTAGAPGT